MRSPQHQTNIYDAVFLSPPKNLLWINGIYITVLLHSVSGNKNTKNSYISKAAISIESDSAFTSYTNGPYNHVVDCGAFDSVDSPSKRRRLRLMTGQCYKKTGT